MNRRTLLRIAIGAVAALLPINATASNPEPLLRAGDRVQPMLTWDGAWNGDDAMTQYRIEVRRKGDGHVWRMNDGQWELLLINELDRDLPESEVNAKLGG